MRVVIQQVAVVVVGVGLLTGCDTGYDPVDHPEGEEAWEIAHDIEVDDEEIVATVEGRPVTRADVEAKWRDMPEASRSEVVDALIEREILAEEARDRDLHQRPEVAFARKQGLVSALLYETVEREAEVDESRRDAVRNHVERTRRAPEGLRASHLVILVPEEREADDGETVSLDDEEREALYEEGRKYIEEARDLLDEDVDDDGLREVRKRLDEEILPADFDARVNEQMRFPRHGEEFERSHLPDGWVGVVDEFAEGAESVAGPERRGEELSEPVRTDFGWHLIRVDEVIEARPVDPEAAGAYVDHELNRGARQAKLHELMEQWAEGVPAEVYPDRLDSPLEN